jgi:hypothetical protein
MYVCMYVCMHVCLYIYIYYICIYILHSTKILASKALSGILGSEDFKTGRNSQKFKRFCVVKRSRCKGSLSMPSPTRRLFLCRMCSLWMRSQGSLSTPSKPEFWRCAIYIHTYLHAYTYTHIYIHIYVESNREKRLFWRKDNEKDQGFCGFETSQKFSKALKL